ncbi:MAG: CPBP family intramembrane glutamic endopeptidase [Ignavibacteriaceae bacterium]
METLIDNDPEGNGVQIELTGSWENKGRIITAAALTGLAGIGALFFYAQSFLSLLLLFIFRNTGHVKVTGDFAEKINIITNEYKTPLLIALSLSEFIFMLVPALWVVKKWHTRDVLKYLRIRICSFKEIIIAVLITVSLLPLCYYLSYLIEQLFKIPGFYKNLGPQLFTAYSGQELITLIFVVAVTPAICEEIFFRGYFQRTLERTIGVKSFVITGILFGLFHMQPLSLVTLSILGMLFSFFYYRSKSIIPSCAAHFTNNFIAIMLLYCQAKSVKPAILQAGNFSALWIILSFIISIGLIFIYYKITKRSRGNDQEAI